MRTYLLWEKLKKLILTFNSLKRKFLTEVDTKDTNCMTKGMVMESSILKMEDTMMVNGRTIKCMVSVNFTTKTEQLHTKAIGKMMNLTVKEEFIIWNQSIFLKISTIRTFLNWETNGHTTMDNLKMTQSMVKDI